MSAASGSRPRTTLIIVILFVLVIVATGALVFGAVTPACGAEASGGSWRLAAALPGARGETGAAVVDGSIVVPGGLDIPDPDAPCGRSITSTIAYDTATRTWAERAPMPGPRDHAAVAASGDLVYVSGGGEIARPAAYANLWAYDPAADSWTDLAPMPGRRWQHAMVALDGVLYVVGGLIDGAADHTRTWAYDIATNTWRTDLDRLPTAREHLAAVVAGGRIVALGGRMGTNLPTVEIYDPVTDSWAPGPDMSTPRGGFAAATLADGIHVTGGEEFVTDRTIGSHEVLDLDTMAWSDAPDLPTPRHGVASAVADGRWYVIAGGRDVGLATSDLVEVWEP
jgi:N-acetylneuraminic acid mutarotase